MIFRQFRILKGQNLPPVMSTRTFVIDFVEDEISLRLLLLHMERWRGKNGKEGFQLYFFLNCLQL